MAKIYWAGDSTVKQNTVLTYPQTGIGQVMDCFVKRGTLIDNHAENGRSTKSFLDEGRLAAIYDLIEEGDFLFIQFGHNDAKVEDPSRYTEAYGEYKDNLVRMIHMARNRKAHPVLITPLTRCWFEDETKMKDHIHGSYPDAMSQVAYEEEVPLVDLFAKSRDYVQMLGRHQASSLFMNLEPGAFIQYKDGLEDNTHLRPEGALIFAGILAEGIRELGGIYKDLIVEADFMYILDDLKDHLAGGKSGKVNE